MIGNSHSKIKKSQILLIIIMMIFTTMTIFLSITFQSNTQVQISKLEEENQKALAAAEAGIEVLLKDQSTGVNFLSESLINFSDEVTVQASLENTTKNNFTTPLLKRDESYTFYLSSYDKQSNSFSSSIPQNIEICFNQNQALEITLIRTDAVKKYVVDATGQINNAASASNICSNNQYGKSYTIASADISNNSQLLIIRNLFADGKIYIKGQSTLPLQGKTIVSQATTKTSVSKKITLFQSYPQIPAAFFYTSF